MKIYFAGSLCRAGLHKIRFYSQVVSHLSSYGVVLNKKIGNENLHIQKRNIINRKIHDYDINLISAADILIADITVPSLGVGYEIRFAVECGKPVFCLYNREHEKFEDISKMILGIPGIKILSYKNFKEFKILVSNFLENILIINKKDYNYKKNNRCQHYNNEENKLLSSDRSWESEAIEKGKEKAFLKEEMNCKRNSVYKKSRIKSIQEQLFLLSEYFPDLKSCKLRDATFPNYSEGWIVSPKYYLLDRDYNRALEIVLEIIQKQRHSFINCVKGELGKKYLRLTTRTIEAVKRLDKKTKGDYLFIPSQVGSNHFGRSARKAYLSLKINEFGLGPFEVAIFILTHLDYLNESNYVGFDCIGCEYSPYKHSYFKHILFFYFHKGILRFNSRWCGCPDKKFGGVTGFLY